MIFYLGEITDIVDNNLRKQRNKNRSWKYGYDPDIDVVIISKDGTLGEVYNVNGLNIGLPMQPLKSQIQNHDVYKGGQRWKRQEIPAGLDASNFNEKQFETYIDEQYQKREQGLWIYLNGKPVWLTGLYWFFLQWVRIEEDYPNLRIIQNELMIFWEACKADSRSFGMQYVKNRRIGASSLAVAELLESGTIYEDKWMGLVSKTGEDAKEIFDRIVTSFKRLPPFFKPEIDGTNSPKKVLSFKEQTKKRAQGEIVKADEGNNTSISWHTTSKNAMDGKRIFRSLLDESGKFPSDVPFDKYWSVVRTSHIKGRVIFGKSMVVSTVNAMDDGGREYKRIWDRSDANERDGNGRTQSGLYRIFIAAKYCLEGYFDQFGFSVVEDPKEPIIADDGTYIKEGSVTYLSNTLESLKNNPADYNEQLRQFPDSERDAFRDEAGNCDFNLVQIIEQLEHNENELEENEYGNNEVERGNFHWKDGIPDTEVIWTPDMENGRFWIAKSCHPPKEYRNRKVKKMLHGVTAWAPENEHIGCFGVDPYNRSKTVDNRGSKGSIHLSTKYNTGPFPNEAFILEYIDRPLKVEYFYEDVIMAMVYYSMPMLAELSNEQFLQTVKDRGYRHFSLNNPFKQWSDLTPTEKEFGGMPPQDAKIGEQQFYAIEAYVQDFIGMARVGTNRMVGEMGYMPFTRTLNQWKDVDTTKRTKYDAYISSSLSRIGNQKRVKPEEAEKKPMIMPFRKYDNSGAMSILT